MIDRYIKELLLENNRVIIPDFGAFIARITAESKEPDSLEHKTIVFNDILKFNDGLLVNYIIKIENTDLTQALQKISDFTQNVVNEFGKGNDFEIEGIGQLHRDKRGNVTLITASDNLKTPPVIAPVVNSEIKEEPVTTVVETVDSNVLPVEPKVIPPSVPEMKEVVIPPPIPQIVAEEKAVALIIIETEQKETVEVSVISTVESKEEKAIVSKPENTEKEIIPVSVEKPVTEEPEKEKSVSTVNVKSEPELVKKEKAKPAKPIKKEVKSQSDKKKGSKWLAITIWSVSGLLFLSLIFMASVKFGFIKGVTLFSGDYWNSVNQKLQKDLDDYNKKHKDNLTLPEVNKDDNNKGAFSGGESGSAGSFDTPATDAGKTNTKDAGTTTTSASSEGSFGSFDTPTETKNTKEEVKEKKETKPVVTKTELNTTTNTAQTSVGSNSAGATGKYVIVAGSFSNKNAADIFMEQLKKKGYTNAEYVGVKNGMHMVCYGSYNDKKEANAEFQKLRQKGVQTWIMNQ